MFKKILIATLIFSSCTFESPTEFSDLALNDRFVSTQNKEVQLKNIINKHKGKKLLINVWASWCKDCVLGFPNLKAFQKKHPNVEYVFISIDRNLRQWKNAIKKYNLEGEHYYMDGGMDSEFGNFLNSNWIPRYMVVNENGFLDLFKAKKITDSRIVEALKK